MVELTDSIKRKLDLVLEEAFRDSPFGGDHETRKMVAAQLLKAAERGKTTLGELGMIARKAVSEIEHGSGR